MPVRGLTSPPPSGPLTPAAAPSSTPAPTPTIVPQSPDLPAMSWHATWTELPRTHLASTSSTMSAGDRAILGVVLGASTFTASLAFAAPASMTYTIDTGDAVATAHTVLFRADGATDFTPTLVAASGAASTTLGLGHPVGRGQTNAAADVTAVQTRLQARGFTLDVDGKYGAGTERAIRVFESMVTGAETLADTTGVITPGGVVDRALAADAGPRWVSLPASGPGFVRIDADGFGYGSSMAADTIRSAGTYYSSHYLATHPSSSLVSVNDVSRARGGPHRDHESHQAGLDVDLNLPTLTGGHSTRVGWASYDREAAYAMIEAFAQSPQVERILFSDTVLLTRIAKSDVPWKDKVVNGGAQHRNHIHVDIKPWAPTV